jgi:hypothetical protein
VGLGSVILGTVATVKTDECGVCSSTNAYVPPLLADGVVQYRAFPCLGVGD